MKKGKTLIRQVLAWTLSFTMMLSMAPVSVFAEENAENTGCSHIHDENCGYVEAVPEVPCDKDCVDTDGDGVIDHVEGCAYTPAVEGQPCNHVHDENCGGLPEETEPELSDELKALQERINALPTGDEYKAMTEEEQEAVYKRAATVSEEYIALSEEDQDKLDITRMEELFAVINEGVSTWGEADVQYESIEIAPNSLNGNAIRGVNEGVNDAAMDNYAHFYSETHSSTGGLPNDGKLTMSSGVPYVLSAGESDTAYDGNDCIRLTASTTLQTMDLQTLGVYDYVYVLATAGGPGTGHYADFNVTLTYTEGEPEQTEYKLYDWYDTTDVPNVEKNYNIMRINNGATSPNGSLSGGPVLHSATIKVDTTRLLKQITFTMNGKDGNAGNMSGLYCCIFAVTGATPEGVPGKPNAHAVMKVEGSTTGAFTATWDKVEGATGYVIDVATDRKFTQILPEYNNKNIGDATTFEVDGDAIDPDTTYYYRVRAINEKGQSLSSNRVATDLPVWIKQALKSGDYEKVCYDAETNTITFQEDITLIDTIILPEEDKTVIDLGGQTVTAPEGKPAVSAGTGENVELSIVSTGGSEAATGSIVGNGADSSGNGAPVIDFSSAAGNSAISVTGSNVTGSSGSNSENGNGGNGGSGIAAGSNTKIKVGDGSTIAGGAGGNSSSTTEEATSGNGGNGGAGITGGTVTVSTGGTVTGGTGGNAANGTGGAGGAGVTGTDVSNSGTVTGGNGGNGSAGGGTGGTAGAPNGTNGNAGGTHVHKWNYSEKDNCIYAWCAQTNSACNYQITGESFDSALRLTLTANDMTYSGSVYQGTGIENSITSVTGATAENITYYQVTTEGAVSGGSSLGTTAPSNAGYYYASVTIGGQTAVDPFTIEKAEQSATVNMQNYNFDGTVSTPTISGHKDSPTVTYYYNTIDSNENGTEWKSITEDTLDTGTYYMYAVLSATANYKEYKTVTTQFQVIGMTMTGIVAEPVVKTYDKSGHGISVSGYPESAAILYGTTQGAYNLTESPKYTNAGSEENTVYFKITARGYQPYYGSTTVKIEPKEVELEWSNTAFTYNGTVQIPVATVKEGSLCTGDTCTVSVTGGEKDYRATPYTATASSLSNANYKLPVNVTQEFSIAQKEINVKWSNTEFTYDRTAHKPTAVLDGVVSGDSCNVTVSGEETNAGTNYTATASIDNSNYKIKTEDAGTTFVIKPKEITAEMISLDAEDNGYEFTNMPITPSVTVKDGSITLVKGENQDYVLTGDTSKTAYGTYEITVNGKGNYTGTPKVAWSINDPNAPTGEIVIKTNKWNSFLNDITFGHFFNMTQKVTVTAKDGENESGVDKLYYYVSETSFESADALSSVEWKEIENGGDFSIDPNAKVYVYVKITDKAGNAAYISTNGIVVYTDSVQDTKEISFTRTSNEDVAAKITLNGNTVNKITNGATELVNGQDYTISEDGATITFKAAYLQSLSAGTYTLTVSYNPGGETYVETADNDRPLDTTIALTVFKTQGSVTDISDLSKTYDGTSVENPSFITTNDRGQNDSNVTVSYKVKGTDDSTYTTDKPVNAGEYVVRVTVKTDANHKEVSGTAEFTISKKLLTAIVSASDKVYDSTAEAEVTAAVETGITGDKLKISGLTGTFAEVNAGNDIAVTVDSSRAVVIGMENTNAGNYTILYPANTQASIKQKTVGVQWGIREFTYDGTGKIPVAIATDLVSGDICNITVIGEKKNAGAGYTVNATGVSNPNYRLPDDKDKTQTTFAIVPKEITVKWSSTDLIYNGTAQKPSAELVGVVTGDTCSVSVDGAQINAGKDYTATASIVNSNYNLKTEDTAFTFTILPKSIQSEDMTVTIAQESYEYDGNTKIPVITVTDKTRDCTLSEGIDYEISGDISKIVQSGQEGYLITVTGKGNYKGSVEKNWSITRALPVVEILPGAAAITYGQKLEDSQLTGGIVKTASGVEVLGTFTWTDGTIKPTVADSGVTAYELIFTPEDTANFDSFTCKVTLTVNPKQVTLSWYPTVFTYNGKPQKPEAKVTNLEEGDEVTVTVSGEQISANTREELDNENGGYTATATALEGTAKDNYKLSDTETDNQKKFKIYPKKITAAMVNAATSYTYTGSGIAPTISVEDSVSGTDGQPVRKVLVSGSDYTLAGDISANQVGSYAIIVTGTGNYTGTVEVDYKITDSSAPTGTIQVTTSQWKSLLNVITFDIFYKARQTVIITAEDESSGVDRIYYYLTSSGEAVNQETLAALPDTKWTEISNGGSFTIDPDNKYVIYAKIMDKSGNVTFISSNGIVLDKNAPTVTGIERNKTYCSDVTFAVSDVIGLASVKIDSEEKGVGGSYTIEAAGERKNHTIVVEDTAGNKTTYIIAINADGEHSFGDWEVVTPATCEEKGIKSHTCSACGFVEAEEIPALEHDYQAAGDEDAHFVWSAEKDAEGIVTGYKATAYFICNNDSSHTDKAQECIVQREITVPATEQEEGTVTYTATATYKDHEYHATKIATLAKLTKLEDPDAAANSNIYTSTSVAENAPATTIGDELDVDLVKDLMTPSEEVIYEDTKVATDITLYLEVQNITGAVDPEETQKVEAQIADLVTEKVNTAADVEVETGATYLDLSMYKNVKTEEKTQEGETVGTSDDTTQITDTGKDITITVEVPSDILEAAEGFTRIYTVIRVHDGNAQALDTKQNGNLLTFRTSKFSTYAITYVDVKNAPENPSSDEDVIIPVNTIRISPDEEKVMKKGESVQLSAVVEPVYATDRKVTWFSSDPKVATVDENGTVTAVEDGTVTITAKTSNGKTATITITVKTESGNEPGESGGTDIKMDTSFAALRLKVTKSTKTSNTLTWTKVADADGYVVYGSPCSTKEQTNKVEKLAVIKDGTETTYKDTGLKSGTYYKYVVKAYKLVDGKKVWLAKSKVVHSTTAGGKSGNAKSVKVNETSVSLTTGKTFAIQASMVKQDKNIKQHTAIKYESSNNKVATVNSKGVITAKGKGTCYVYVYAQNGVYKKIKVTVK